MLGDTTHIVSRGSSENCLTCMRIKKEARELESGEEGEGGWRWGGRGRVL